MPRLSPSEKIKELQAMDPSQWLSSPYITQIDNESIITLLKMRPEGFAVLINSSYINHREKALSKTVLFSMIEFKPNLIELVPKEYLSNKLFLSVEAKIKRIKDPYEQNLIVKALEVAKHKLNPVNAQVESMNTEEQTIENVNEEQKELFTDAVESNTTSDEESATDNMPVADNQETDGSIKVNEPSIDTKEPTEDTLTLDTNVNQVNVSSDKEAIDGSIKTAMLDVYFDRLFKQVSESVSNTIIEQNQTMLDSFKSDATSQINTISSNLDAQVHTLKVLNETLANPTKSLLNGFEEETKRSQEILISCNELLEKQAKQTEDFVTNYSSVLKEPSNEFFNSLQEHIQQDIHSHITDTYQASVKEASDKATESMNAIVEVVKATANSSIQAIQVEHDNHHKVLEEANNFFEKKKFVQNLALVVAILDVLLLLIIVILLVR